MQKILVEINIPAIGTKFDAYIPLKVPMHQIIGMMSKAIVDLSEGRFIPVKDTVFCDKDMGIPLDINMNAKEHCLHNGSCLMLV